MTRVEPDKVRFGTSSFSSADWVGPFYPPRTPAGEFLRYYATQFDCVEIDSTYYAVPAPATVDGWVAKTPASFVIAAKFPRSIVHGGESRIPDARRILDPATTYAERDEFLGVMSRLGGRLGPLVLQFPFFAADAFPTVHPFLERLDRFLGDLPREFAYAVEVRNADWIAPPLAELLRRHTTALVIVDQAWMPHGDRVARWMDVVTAPFAYVRLLGDRRAIEAITTTWEREVIDQSAQLERWAALLAAFASRGVPTFVFANNHYAGHAPATVRRLESMYRARVGLPQRPPETLF
jgi:uncharacterized protein YecE (DUF72 family)